MKDFELIDISIEGTSLHKEIREHFLSKREESFKEIEALKNGMVEAKELIRKSGYLSDTELEEFFMATDSMIGYLGKIIDYAMETVKGHNELVENYHSYKSVGEYWDKEYDKREAKFKINGIRSNTIH